MDPFATRRIGRTDVEVTLLGLGGGTLGDPDEIISEAQAEATLEAAYDEGVRLFDTAPWYGNTKSEHRVGHHLRQRPRKDFRLTTKVGRIYSRPSDPESFDFPRWKGGLHFDLRFDYTRDGVLRSYEQSLQRLGINTVDALVIHDLDWRHQKIGRRRSSGLQTIDRRRRLRGAGRVAVFGRDRRNRCRYELYRIDPPVSGILRHRLLLDGDALYPLDQPALDEDLPLCQERGVGIVIGAVFASGILATGPRDGALYAYQPAEREIMTKARGIADICDRHGVPLAAAALQFPLHHPAVATVIPGANSPEQVRQCRGYAAQYSGRFVGGDERSRPPPRRCTDARLGAEFLGLVAIRDDCLNHFVAVCLIDQVYRDGHKCRAETRPHVDDRGGETERIPRNHRLLETNIFVFHG